MKSRTDNVVITLSVGLALNILLGTVKLVAGILSRSSSVTSDGVNNLSDAAVSVVTIVATCLAARGADHKHPHGHGRYEYIATMLLGAVIIAVGAEVFTSGIKHAIAPQPVAADALMFSALGASIAVKAFMAVLYLVHGRRAGSDTMKAAAIDSVSDVAVTSVVLVCAIIEHFTSVMIDGYVSIAVAVVILVMGLRIVKQTVSRLLGERPDPKLFGDVENIILSHPEVLSVHDIVINDYGAANKTAEADAVFDAKMKFVDVHRICDAIEREVRDGTGVRLSLHADPLERGNKKLNALREEIEKTLAPFDAAAHDIEICDGEKTVRLDIAVKSDKTPTAEIIEIVRAQVKQSYADCEVKIDVDYV